MNKIKKIAFLVFLLTLGLGGFAQENTITVVVNKILVFNSIEDYSHQKLYGKIKKYKYTYLKNGRIKVYDREGNAKRQWAGQIDNPVLVELI